MNKIVVVGSGVMGSGIAAHIANSGTAVVLLDIVPEGAKNRNIFTESAVERMLHQGKSPFTLKSNVQFITCGNLEDNMHLVRSADWIIEAVSEKLDVKQNLYRQLDEVRKHGSIISSNTSTILLKDLIAGLPEHLRRDMLVTHFFNPPRTTRLLELVTHEGTNPAHIAFLEEFLDVKLGKTVVYAKDMPGFIANRIGVFWLVTALVKAISMGVLVEEADSLLAKPLGIPRTGVFGLIDLVGIDLIPQMAESMLRNLPASDDLHQLYKEPLLVRRMIAQGFTGRKGKGGFYRVLKKNGFSFRQVMDLVSGQYRLEQEVLLDSIHSSGIKGLVTFPDRGGEYVWQVMSHVLAYSCRLVPAITDTIWEVDRAMKAGFNWRYGPFELLDQLGPAWFREKLKQEKRAVPPLLAAIGKGHFYQGRHYFRGQKNNKHYEPIPYNEESWQLADVTVDKVPVLSNASARLWDIDDGVLCLEFTTPMNSFDTATLDLLEQAIPLVQQQFKGLLIANDSENFSVGVHLKPVLEALHKRDYASISAFVKRGQAIMQQLKYGPFSVVMAISGMTLGAACEMALHVDAVQAHADSVMGLVETNIGLIPGWGGCTALLSRRLHETDAPDESMNTIFQIFEQIAFARKSRSAEEARSCFLLNEESRITMNRTRLLPDAKRLCLMLAENYRPKEKQVLHMQGPVIKAALGMTIYGLLHDGKITPYEEKICCQLANVLSAGGADAGQTITEQHLYDLEHAAFMRLIAAEQTVQRIAYTLNTGRVLKN